MRIWDISPGYLNRQSLLGEHRELHGLHSILVHGKKGYSRHPETLRWIGCLSGLVRRHALLVTEMRLRGFNDRTPLEDRVGAAKWPEIFINPAAEQLSILGGKYVDRAAGRIPLPRNVQELWAQHKYSVMARDAAESRAMSRRVTGLRRGVSRPEIASELTLILRQPPSEASLANAVEHMWGHVSHAADSARKWRAQQSLHGMFTETCALTMQLPEPYLTASTALGELSLFIR